MKLIGIIVFLSLFAAAVFGFYSYASVSDETAKKPGKIEEELDAVMETFKEVHQVPGFAVGILKADTVIYAKGFGVRSLETKEPVTTRSLFHMASVSKPFVATAIMQLKEKGKIKLEGKLIEYLPYFKIDDERYKDITIGQMLSHISGLPDVRDYEWDKPQYDDGAAERYIRSLTKERLIVDPGTLYRYSNMAFDILADVIARASGMTFEAYMKENIFKPLEMKESTFLKKEVPQTLGTSPHVVTDFLNYKVSVSNVYPYNRAHAPSSTLHSNVMDMFNWATANLNGGVFKGKRILQRSGHKLMWTPRVKADGRSVGLSWFISDYKGNKTISHGGGDVGYRTFFLLVPGKSIAVVTLGNSETFRSRDVAFAALDILLGEEPESPKKPIIVPVGRIIAKKGAKAAVELYYQLKKNKPSNYDFREYLLNQLGYGLLDQNKIEDAIEIFKLNVKEYPESWNVYDSLGEAYMTKGDKANAIKNYEMALKLIQGKNDREKRNRDDQIRILKELKGEK